MAATKAMWMVGSWAAESDEKRAAGKEHRTVEMWDLHWAVLRVALTDFWMAEKKAVQLAAMKVARLADNLAVLRVVWRDYSMAVWKDWMSVGW